MKKLLQSLFIFLFIAGTAIAQDRTITGTVTDKEDGKPLPGVTVRIKGATGATQTSGDGKYSIKTSSAATAIEFSYLGYVSQSKPISGNVVNAILVVDARSLTEVVVTGIGIATDRRKTAISIETISSKEMLAVPSASIDQALIGKVAGAQISSTSGQPGQQASIILRGINTLKAGTQPMILIDGVQVNSGGSENGSATNVSSRLSDLDLSNVDRVEVIQGSAAATLYGAQGANGVIQIFTKRGIRNGETRISVTSRVNIDNPLRGKFEVAKNHYFNTDAEGYIQSNNPGNPRIAMAADGTWDAPGIPASLVTALNNKPYKEKTYDHFDQIFKSNVPTFNNGVNISGGADKFDYAVNISNLSQESVLSGNLSRSNLSLNVGVELVKNLTLRSTTQLIYSKNTTGGITGQNNVYSALGSGLTSRAYWDLTFKDALGNSVSNPELDNSVNPLYTDQFRDNTAKNTRIVQGMNLNYKFPKFVEVDYKYGIDSYRYDFQDDILYQLNSLLPGYGLDPFNGRITLDRDKETFQNSLLSVYFKTNFEDDFNSSLPIQTSTQFSYDYRKRSRENVTTEGTGFPGFPPFTAGLANTKTYTSEIKEFITYGYLVNQRIDYGSLFGVSGGLRVDYSSEFGAGSKAFVFPRGDAYFRFDQLIKNDKLFELKLRGAYGEAGIQPEEYARRVTLDQGSIGNNGYLSTQSVVPNPDLRVEKTAETEVGIDAGLLLGKNQWFEKIRLNATYWDRKSKDVIRELDIAPSSGAGQLNDNLLSLKSSGFQLAIDADIYTSDNFNWQFGTRFGASKSMVDKITGGKDVTIGTSGAGQFVLREGESIGAFFGKRPLSSFDELDPSGARYIPAANVGNYTMVNGMVVETATKSVLFTSNQTLIGDPNPDFTVSFTNSFTFKKNLSLSFQVDWTHGNEVYNQTKQWLYRDLIHGDLDKSVTIGNETAPFVNYYNSIYQTNNTNSYFVEDGSFVRLRDVTLSYNFNSLIKSKFVRSAQLSVSGRNLFTITDYTGFDPEAAAGFNDPLNRGLDLYAFPNFRSVQVALSLGF